MNLRNKLTSFLLIASASFYAQESSNNEVILTKESKISYLDSIKKTFVRDEMASCIDSLWMKELTSTEIYDDLLNDIKNIDVDKKVDYELSTDLLKERLKKMDEKSPFNIEYNVGLENVIKSLLKKRKRSYERLMGISQYYFPLFEEELAKKNIPLEIKYLAVVESALNPRAISRVGATGLWQFMYQTGKQYGLNIDSYVDDRIEPLKASAAASQYMKNMYKIFGDWDLVLASYNSGPGNVAKAIRRSGGQQNYWNIRKNLPKETQGYLPAFLATMYIFEYHKEHGIVPDKAIANQFATDTVMVKNHMTFKQISNLLDIPVSEIQFFNPSYKRNEIPHITGEEHFLRLPKDKIAIFTSNEDKVYAYIKYEESKRERPNERIANSKVKDSINGFESENRFVNRTRIHKVRRGDNLSEIADKYDVSVADLKKWNGLRSNKAPIGKRLKIVTTESIAYKVKKENVKQVTKDTSVVKAKDLINTKNTDVASVEPKVEKVYKTEKVISYKDVVKQYKVKKGDNLGEIAERYDVSITELKKWNHLKKNTVQAGKSLKIISNEKVVTTVRKEVKPDVLAETERNIRNQKNDSNDKDSYVYTVQKGDNLATIAKKNNVSVEDLKEWNDLEGNSIPLDTKLKVADISKDSKGNYGNFKTEIKAVEYITQRGDNISTIAKKYGSTVSDIKDWNNLEDEEIAYGTKIIVAKKLVLANSNEDDSNNPKDQIVAETKKANNKKANKKEKENHYYVQKGDSLFSIAKKYPGITVSELKKWNGIKGSELRPGMKLKING